MVFKTFLPFGLRLSCLSFPTILQRMAPSPVGQGPANRSFSRQFFNGTASARTSDPGASVGRVLRRTIWMKASISRRSGGNARDVAKNFYDVAKESVQCCEPSSMQHPTRDVCIDVASLFVVCCEQHASNIQCFGKKVQGAHGCPPVSRVHTGEHQFHAFTRSPTSFTPYVSPYATLGS
jgi:hypothetical protein